MTKRTVEALAARQRELLSELTDIREEIARRHGEEHEDVSVEAISTDAAEANLPDQEPEQPKPVKRGRPRKSRG